MTGLQARKPLAADHTGQRLDEHALVEGDAVGEDENPAVDVQGGDTQVLAESSRVVIGRVQRLAGRVAALEAVVACIAGNVMRNKDAVSGPVALDAIAFFDDHPGNLVPEDDGRLLDPVPLHDVAAADAAGHHLDEQFPRTDLRYGPLFDPHVMVVVVDGYFHGLNNSLSFLSLSLEVTGIRCHGDRIRLATVGFCYHCYLLSVTCYAAYFFLRRLARIGFHRLEEVEGLLHRRLLVDDGPQGPYHGDGMGDLPDVSSQINADGAPLQPVMDKGHHFELGLALGTAGHDDGDRAPFDHLVKILAPVCLDHTGPQLGGDPAAQCQVAGLALLQFLADGRDGHDGNPEVLAVVDEVRQVHQRFVLVVAAHEDRYAHGCCIEPQNLLDGGGEGFVGEVPADDARATRYPENDGLASRGIHTAPQDTARDEESLAVWQQRCNGFSRFLKAARGSLEIPVVDRQKQAASVLGKAATFCSSFPSPYQHSSLFFV